MMILLAADVTIPLGLDLYMPVPEENLLTPKNIEVGRRLLVSDRRLSRDGSVSCSTCHVRERAFPDGKTVAVGVSMRAGRRNTPALINRGYGRTFLCDGRVATLEEQVTKPIEYPREMDLPLAEASARVGLDAATMARALASFVRSILSGDSPFDRFVNGDRRSESIASVHGWGTALMDYFSLFPHRSLVPISLGSSTVNS